MYGVTIKVHGNPAPATSNSVSADPVTVNAPAGQAPAADKVSDPKDQPQPSKDKPGSGKKQG